MNDTTILDKNGNPIEQDGGELPPVQSSALVTVSSAGLLQLAVEKGASIEALERLMALHERHEANEARKAYVVAMAEFKRSPPRILKTRKVDTGTFEYFHARLGDISDAVTPALAAVGLSFDWEVPDHGKNGITIECVITHELGHSKRVALTGPPDTGRGRNAMQAVASTTTYLSRYTLLLALGLATHDDDDGRAGYAATQDDEPEAQPEKSEKLKTIKPPNKPEPPPSSKATDDEIGILAGLAKDARELDLTTVAETIALVLSGKSSVTPSKLIDRARAAITAAERGDEAAPEPPPGDDPPPAADEPELGDALPGRASDAQVSRLRKYLVIAGEIGAGNDAASAIGDALSMHSRGQLTIKGAGSVIGEAVKVFTATGRWEKPQKPLVRQRKRLEAMHAEALPLPGGADLAASIVGMIERLNLWDDRDRESERADRVEVDAAIASYDIALTALSSDLPADMPPLDESATDCKHEAIDPTRGGGMCMACGELGVKCDCDENDLRFDVYGRCRRCSARKPQ